MSFSSLSAQSNINKFFQDPARYLHSPTFVERLPFFWEKTSSFSEKVNGLIEEFKNNRAVIGPLPQDFEKEMVQIEPDKRNLLDRFVYQIFLNQFCQTEELDPFIYQLDLVDLSKLPFIRDALSSLSVKDQHDPEIIKAVVSLFQCKDAFFSDERKMELSDQIIKLIKEVPENERGELLSLTSRYAVHNKNLRRSVTCLIEMEKRKPEQRRIYSLAAPYLRDFSLTTSTLSLT